MVRTSLAIIAAVAGISACSSPAQRDGYVSSLSPSANIASQEWPYRAGTGVVVSTKPAPMAGATANSNTAAAGSNNTVPAASTASGPMQRMLIKMDDGNLQYVDTASSEFQQGTRVELSADRTIKKI